LQVDQTLTAELEGKPSIVRRTYDWVLHWANTPYGTPALFILAFVESSVFPIPPDLLLIPLCLAVITRAFFYALVCSVGSVLGGVFGYGIGYFLMDSVGFRVLTFYGVMDKYGYLQSLYQNYDAWVVAISGFTPIPYKVFTISAGAFHIDLWIFILASTLGRSARFFMVAALIYKFGPTIKSFIDRYFNILTILFTIVLIGGFIVIRYFL